MAIEPGFDKPGFSDGLTLVSASGRFRFVDEHGAVVIPATFDQAWQFSEDLAAAGKNDRWGFIGRA